MNPTNYQAETERVITALAAENRRNGFCFTPVAHRAPHMCWNI